MNHLDFGFLTEKIIFFYKVFKNEHPQYFFHLIPVRHSSYTSRNIHNICIFNLTQFFFPSTMPEWSKLDPGIRNSKSLSIFRKNISHFIWPASNSVYNCRHPNGVKFIKWLWLGLNHLRGHEFKHNFQNSIDPLCNRGQGMVLNTQLIFFSTVSCFLMKEAFSSAL